MADHDAHPLCEGRAGNAPARPSVVPPGSIPVTSVAVPQPRVLLTGVTGQLGFELVRELAPLGLLHTPNRDTMNLLRPGDIRNVVREMRPTLIVNAAAYTAVDAAETNVAECTALNADAPAVLAEEARRCGAAI